MDQLTKIKELVTPILQEEDILLYDVKWHTEGKNRILQISIMRKDGSMDIDTCAAMSEKISEKLDEVDMSKISILQASISWKCVLQVQKENCAVMKKFSMLLENMYM